MSYRTVAQIDLVTGLLAQSFPSLCTRIELPEPSVQGRPVYALRLRAGDGDGRRGVLAIGGVHARELMNPDMLLELAVDLVISYRTGNDLVLGARVWPAADVRVLLETLDIYLLPCTNPDGRLYVMTVDDMWRKNRRPNAGTTCVGVDLNRNADVLWGVAEGQTSCDACVDTFVGSAAFSEPESRNVRHLLDRYRIDCFADVHSFSELVLYPWGHAANQTTDPTAQFTTLATGTCAPVRPGYREYIAPRDLQRYTTVAQRIVTAIADVRGRVYTAQQGKGLYGTTGTNSDYAWARHIAHPDLRRTYGYTIETGPQMATTPESFHPADPEPIKREAESGVLALFQQCICAIELIGWRSGRAVDVDGLRSLRDRVLATTPAGREWIALAERVQLAAVRTVTSDEGAAAAAEELLTLSARLLADESAVLDADTVVRVRTLLETVRDRATPADAPVLGAAADAARDVLEQVSGGTTGDLVRSLIARGPQVSRRPAPS